MAAGGTAIGDALGGPVGGALGAAAGGLLSNIFGFGDYFPAPRKNTILDTNNKVAFGGPSGVRIKHSEFVCDLTPRAATWGPMAGIHPAWDPTADAAEQIQINPANAALFPWLSHVALGFSEYKIHGMVFHYKPTSGTYAGATSTSALGSIQMAVQYNPNAQAFTTKQEIDSYDMCVSGVPYSPMIMPLECAPLSNVRERLFVWQSNSGIQISGNALEGGVATGATPYSSSADYNMGQITVASSSVPYDSSTVAALGELWIAYDIEFFLPRISTVRSESQMLGRNQEVNTCTQNAPLGTSDDFVWLRDSTPGHCSSNIKFLTNRTMLVNKKGVWEFTFQWVGSAMSNVPVIAPLPSNLVILTDMFTGNTHSTVSVNNSGNASLKFRIKCLATTYGANQSKNVLEFSGPVSMTGGNVELVVHPINDHLIYTVAS